MCGMHQSRLYRHGDVHHVRSARAVTETHAWCNLGQHMVEHASFAKNQRTCRECL